MKRSNFRTFLIILTAILLASSLAYGQEMNKTFSWKYNINTDARVSVKNYDCSLSIHAWDRGMTEFRLSVEAEGRSQEDITLLEKYLQELVFSNSPSSVSFNSSFWESRNTIMNRTTMKLPGGRTVSLKSFEIKGELWVPASCSLLLDSKYSRVNMDDFYGQLTLDLYNNTFSGGNVTAAVDLTDKYSTIGFRDLKNIRVSLYNSRLNAGNTGDIEIGSKYSEISLASCGKIVADSYNDKYKIPKTADVSFTSKYSDLRTETSGNVSIDLYDGTVIMGEIKDLKISSKYGEFQFAKTGRCIIPSSYNDKLNSGSMISLHIDESKYTSFAIDYLEESFEDRNSYNDNFTVSGTGEEFSGLSLNGKYINAAITLPGKLSYHFKANVKYAEFKMNESALRPIEKIVDGSNVKYDAFRGTESAGMPVIEVNGYEVTLKITEK